MARLTNKQLGLSPADRNVTESINVTLKAEAQASNRYSIPSSALSLLNEYAEKFGGRDPFDVYMDAGLSPTKLGERQKEAISDCVRGIGQLMVLLAPHPGHGEKVNKIRRGSAQTCADLIHELELNLRNVHALRACAICRHWFEPRRRDQSCCTKACAGVARIRRHRAKQAGYEYKRKVRLAGVKIGEEKNE
jgi:hypothetical protein